MGLALTPSRQRLTALLAAEPGISAGGFAERMWPKRRMKKAWMVAGGFLAKLGNAGLVARNVSMTGFSPRFYLTEQGTQLLAQHSPK